MCIHVDIFFI